jgi:hypothetical protein
MGGTNLKIALSTAESGHFAIAVSREQKRSVVGQSGPLPSPEAATKNAIANCRKRGGTDSCVMAQWADALMHCLVREPLSTPAFYGFNRGRCGTSLKSATAILLK